MNENVQDYVMTYSFTKLEETARTFRRLGEAYESTALIQKDRPGISKQLFLVADVLDECMTMHLHTEDMDKSYIKDMIKKCFLSGIKIRNVHMIISNSGKSELILEARTVGRNCISSKKLYTVVNSVLKHEYYPNETNRLIINDEYVQYVFIQEDRFQILSGIAKINKDNEEFSGDNFLVLRQECGKTIAAIADGMGSGKKACVESKMVIELLENCLNAGFDTRAAIDLINSAYIASGEASNPVTIDLSMIDCQTGVLQCIKLGAVSTFIKRDNWVELIQSTTLPIGVLEQVDYDCANKKLYDGNYVIMVSDGILDNLNVCDKEKKFVEIINSVKLKEPNAMARVILDSALECNNMKAVDDMTVMVLGVFDTNKK